MALSLRQQAFVSHYLVERNGRKAAIAAGYAPQGAAVQATGLLRNPNIASEIAAETDQLLKDVHITKGDVLLKLYRVASYDPLDAFDDEGRLRLLKDMPLELRQCIKSIKVRRVNLDPGDGMMDTIYEVQFCDKMKALELLAGHLGLLQKEQPDQWDGEIRLSWRSRTPVQEPPPVTIPGQLVPSGSMSSTE